MRCGFLLPRPAPCHWPAKREWQEADLTTSCTAYGILGLQVKHWGDELGMERLKMFLAGAEVEQRVARLLCGPLAPPGDDEGEMGLWRNQHEDGEEEDLEKHEVEEAIRLRRELDARAAARVSQGTHTRGRQRASRQAHGDARGRRRRR